MEDALKRRLEQGWRDLGMQGSEPSAVFKDAKAAGSLSSDYPGRRITHFGVWRVRTVAGI